MNEKLRELQGAQQLTVGRLQDFLEGAPRNAVITGQTGSLVAHAEDGLSSLHQYTYEFVVTKGDPDSNPNGDGSRLLN